MKLWIVTALEATCTRLDKFGCLGCRIGLASWAVDLDDRWHAGFWGD